MDSALRIWCTLSLATRPLFLSSNITMFPDASSMLLVRHSGVAGLCFHSSCTAIFVYAFFSHLWLLFTLYFHLLRYFGPQPLPPNSFYVLFINIPACLFWMQFHCASRWKEMENGSPKVGAGGRKTPPGSGQGAYLSVGPSASFIQKRGKFFINCWLSTAATTNVWATT